MFGAPTAGPLKGALILEEGFSGVITSAMSRAKIGIFPQLTIGFVEAEFSLENFSANASTVTTWSICVSLPLLVRASEVGSP